MCPGKRRLACTAIRRRVQTAAMWRNGVVMAGDPLAPTAQRLKHPTLRLSQPVQLDHEARRIADLEMM